MKCEGYIPVLTLSLSYLLEGTAVDTVSGPGL